MSVDQGRYFANNLYRQLQDFISIERILSPRFPLPSMRIWAISPDFGVLLLKELLRDRPRHLMELGSGVSTLLTAYCLERQGNGRLLSIDHDERFLEHTRLALKDHGLESFVELRHAPLVPLELDGESFEYYSPRALEIEPGLELLTIDGPPVRQQANARLPALQLLEGSLAPRATVLLDDAARAGEKAAVASWCARWPAFLHEYVACEKGASILRRG